MVAVAAQSAQNLSRYGIGASEIAAVCGMNPYSSPWDVWLRATGQTPELEQTEPMEWGHRLEPAIRQAYADRTGLLVTVPPSSLFHPQMTWARATPDGIAHPKDAPEHLVQCKNVGTWVERNWEHAPPAYVQLQEQWEMLVTGHARADIAVLIGGNEFRIHTVHRDDKAIADLVTIAEAFWRKVETRTQPAIDDSAACRQHFEKRLSRDAVEMTADLETEQLFEEWHALTLQQKRTEKRIETIRNHVRAALVEGGATAIRSLQGTAKLSAPSSAEGKTVTDWEAVARDLGARAPKKLEAAIAAATTTKPATAKAPTLYAPRAWSKES